MVANNHNRRRAPSRGAQQRDGQLSCRHRVAAGGVHDQDSFSSGLRDVNVVNAHARTADNLHVGGLRQERRGGLKTGVYSMIR